MKSVRLLPVVILAVAALLVFKTIGLVTNGGYVLGPQTVQASEGGAAPPAEGADTAPAEPTLIDTNPELVDTAPTLGSGPAKAGEHGEAAPAEADGHGEAEAPAGEDAGHSVSPADAAHAAATANAAASAPAADPAAADAAPLVVPDARAAAIAAASAAAATACPPLPVMEDTTPDASATLIPDAKEAPKAEGEGKAKGHGDATTSSVTNPNCDPKAEGVPAMVDGTGKPVPLASADGDSLTDKTLLERLSQRRAELDAMATQLDLRQSLVEAAEKKIDERAATLKTMEDQIGKLVDQRKDQETGQFASIVTMYENMKPKDAAAIFDNLDMNVLLPVAKAMNPRKMSPILAAMTSQRAQDLTVAMASAAATPAETMTPQDVSQLPQIVGQ